MKVGVWINEDINSQEGGGFSYTDRLINLIDEYDFNDKLEIVFISPKPLNYTFKKEVVFLESYLVNKSKTIIQRLVNFIVNRSYVLKRIYYREDEVINNRNRNNHYRKQLIENKIDVIFYMSQMKCYVEDFPFISNNWDIGHLSMYSFPEVTSDKIFENRNFWYTNTLKKALSIFSESEAGKQELISYLNINPKRIKVLPIFPGGVIHQKISKVRQKELLNSINLKDEQFFFYPAQFWAHKNHVNLLMAFKKILNKNSNIKLIFTGSDKGNLQFIKSQIKKHNLESNVIYLGFVELETIFTLYTNAIALVMPTFLGPTNMPLLEARALGCPVLCSDFDGHREQLEEGAVYFNPLEMLSIAKAMDSVLDQNYRQQLITISKTLEQNSKFNETNSIKAFESNLLEISKYKNCWN